MGNVSLNLSDILQFATSGLLIWGVKLQFQLWMKVTKLETSHEDLVNRVVKLENK